MKDTRTILDGIRRYLNGNAVLVFDVGSVAGYWMAKNLLDNGIPVAYASRYRSTVVGLKGIIESASIRTPYSTDTEWIGEIRRLESRANVGLIVPVADYAFVASTHRDFFMSDVVAGQARSMCSIHNKVNLPEIAAASGVRTPPTHIIRADDADADSLLRNCFSELGPFVLKRAHCTNGDGTEFVLSRDDAAQAAGGSNIQWDSVAQQFVEGRLYSVGALFDREKVHVMGVVEDCQLANQGSRVTIREVIEHPGLEQDMLNLVGLLQIRGFRGVLHAEFIVCSDGARYVIELNPRIWGGFPTLLHAGIDFPIMMIAEHLGLLAEHDEPILRPRPGIRSIHVLGELRRALHALKAGRPFQAFGAAASAIHEPLSGAIVDDSCSIRDAFRNLPFRSWRFVKRRLQSAASIDAAERDTWMSAHGNSP